LSEKSEDGGEAGAAIKESRKEKEPRKSGKTGMERKKRDTNLTQQGGGGDQNLSPRVFNPKNKHLSKERRKPAWRR